MKPETRQRNALIASYELEAENAALLDPRDMEVPLPVTDVPGVTFARLSTIQPKPIRWLWPGRIPHGAMTLIIGDPGLGKSQLTLDIAACVSRGRPWPDMTPCDLGNVLLIAGEDSIERTVMPRLAASGAALERIIALEDVAGMGGRRRMFDLKADLDVVEKMVVENHIELIIIDPLNGYLGSTNSWKEAEVRAALTPACAMAERHDVALLGIMHLNKDNTRSAIHRVIGSVAFGAVARAMFAVAPHPQFPGLRYFVSVKQNYAVHPPTLGFVLVDGGSLHWDGREYETVTADSLLAIVGAPEEKAERRNAREFLANLLQHGPVRTAEIVKAAGLSMIADKMLHRAKYDLKVQSQHVGSPSGTGTGGYWEWRLP